MSALPNGVPPGLSSKAPAATANHGTTDAVSPAVKPPSALATASSPSEAASALGALHARESALSSRLEALVASHADLSRDLLRLDSLRAALGAQLIAARSVSNGMLSGAADTAGRLSGRVRALDLEKARVEATLRVVEQVAELKACVAGVVGSMGAPQDWEAAAGYIARAGRIPPEIVASGFASAVVPTVEVPDPPAVTLEAAREALCGLFLREFDKATHEGDGARVTRFFKLFPLIGRGDVGLDVYGKYVCQGVAGTARAVLKEGTAVRRDAFFYATALTKLFEHIAHIVEGHGGLVERHYGTGKMVRVIERLQSEVDVQGGIILDTWSDERNVDRKLTDVKSYPFSFLVQNFVAQQRGIAGTSRVNSPALGGGANQPRNSEDEGVDMKEVDGLLGEIAFMLGRWALYARFLAGKCRVGSLRSASSRGSELTPFQDPAAPEDSPLSIPDLLTRSNMDRKVSAKLITPYKVMSTFFARRSVEKAFQLDEPPSGLSLNMSRPIDTNPPYIISAVDDVMYIVSAILQKAISTSQRDVVASVISTVGRVLSSDFVGMIQKKMRDESYPKANQGASFPPEDKIIGFVVLINSLDMANEYLARIMTSRLGISLEPTQGPPADGSPGIRDAFPFEHDVKLATSELRHLHASFSAKSTELLNEGIQVLFNNVVRPRLRPILTETFRDADYALSEDELAELAAQADDDDGAVARLLEQVPRRFEHGWEALVRPVARLMTPRTFAALLDVAARHLARVLEKRVWSYAGRTSPYGAGRLERDFNGIVGAVARGGGSYALRELFARTTQILTVANMEDDEWDELAAEEEALAAAGGAAGPGDVAMVWVLTEEERRRARGLVKS